MKKNMGNVDRAIRIIVALIIAGLYFTNVITGTLGIVALVLAGIFVLTSLVSFCPLYALCGASTCPMEVTEAAEPMEEMESSQPNEPTEEGK